MREATKYDKTEIERLMQLFRLESDIPAYKGIHNPEYWNKLLDTIFAGAGKIFIEEGKGLLMALIVPTLWCDKTLYMQELAWYVQPEYRNTTLGYRLLKAYIDYGKQLKDEGRIAMFCLGKMTSSPDMKYERFGFTKLDENWMQ